MWRRLRARRRRREGRRRLILAYLASGCRVNRTQATAALSELISVGRLACRDGRYSLCQRRQRPRALLLRTDAEVLRTAASPTPASPTGSTRPTSVPFWRQPTSCKPATKAGCSEVKLSPQRRSGKRGHRAHPRYRALNKVYIIPLDVPAGGAPGVTPSPAPCGSSDTGPGSSGSVSSAYCVASWSSSVGYPSVISSCLPSPLLFVVLVCCIVL